jgi:putative zinc finger/helix-turn-helix YgiT family protein
MQADERVDEARRCPTCGQPTLQPRQIDDEFEYGPEGERITIVAHAVPVQVCQNSECGETLYGPEAAKVHHQAICAALGLLTPEQIKALRERLGPSQEEFAGLTGIGVATLSRWERGRLLQTRALDRYLRLLDALPEAIRVLKEAGNGKPNLAERFPGREFSAQELAQARRFRLKAPLSAANTGSTRSEPSEEQPTGNVSEQAAGQ